MASMVEGCDPDSPKMRAKAHEDWIISGSLEPLRDGFEDSDFQAIVKQFAADHATDFMAQWPDGSHPLLWTVRHQEYKALFEAQLENTLSKEGMSKDNLMETIQHLQDVQASLGDQAENINGFIKNLTAAEDYNVFLQVMFNEVQKQQDAGTSVAADPRSRVIEVAVPEGFVPGQVMPIEYEGFRYELVVPDSAATGGYSAGMTFQVSVIVPTEQ
eukprot:gb/GFBE01082381.1/.p1 GENE.gb/GFBE01082381.1/~~gb/GFBE01082381.1/.p1  ORF type:complete len:215 (+),score=47.95 gb/GFBE01082381.1/:1-645(+)